MEIEAYPSNITIRICDTLSSFSLVKMVKVGSQMVKIGPKTGQTLTVGLLGLVLILE